MAVQFATFREFWPYYLRQHKRRLTRLLHFTGTLAAVGVLLLSHVMADWRLVPLAIVIGYALSWFGHAVFECNRPATFSHPLWSFRADFKMLWLWLSGRLDRELRKAGVGSAVAAPGE